MELLTNEKLKPYSLVPGKLENTDIEMQVRNISGMFSDICFKKALDCSLISYFHTFIQILPSNSKSVKVKSQLLGLFIDSHTDSVTVLYVSFICCSRHVRLLH